MADEENIDDQETVEEEAVTEADAGEAPVEEEAAAPKASEFIPDILQKPKNDDYTALMILTFAAFFIGAIIAGRELWEHYDVQFFIFGKK